MCSKSLHLRKLSCGVLRIFKCAKCFDLCICLCTLKIEKIKTITNLYFSIFQHVRNSLDGEARVLTPAQSYNVDGYHAPSNTVYEYYGCFYHGCRKCTPTQRQKKRNCHPDRTIDEVYLATCLKTAILRDAGYTVIEKWGCEFAEQKKTDPELQAFLEKFEMVPPLSMPKPPKGKTFPTKISLPCTRG